MKSNSNCFPLEECGDIGIWIIKRLDLTISVSEKFYTRQIEALSKKDIVDRVVLRSWLVVKLQICEIVKSWAELLWWLWITRLSELWLQNFNLNKLSKKKWVDCQKWLLSSLPKVIAKNSTLRKQTKLIFEQIFKKKTSVWGNF